MTLATVPGIYKGSFWFFLQLLEGNFALFCSSTLGFRDDFQNILLVIMVSVHSDGLWLPPLAPQLEPSWQWNSPMSSEPDRQIVIFCGGWVINRISL
jgi:hypothetical protein